MNQIDYRFTGLHQSLFVGLQITTTLGGIASLLLLISILRKKSLRTLHNSFSIMLALVDFVLCITFSYFTLADMGQTSTTMTYTGCQINGAIVQLCTGLNVLTLNLMAWYHYYIIVLERPEPRLRTFLGVYLVMIVFAITIIGIPFMDSDYPYRLQPSGLWCGIPTNTWDPFDQVSLWCTVVFLLITPFVLAYVYRSIFNTFGLKGKHYNLSLAEINTLTNIQRQIVRRAIVISMSFIVVWTMMAFIFLSSAVSSHLVHWKIDAVAVCLARANTFVSPLVFFSVDSRYRYSLYEFLGISKRFIKQDNPSFNHMT